MKLTNVPTRFSQAARVLETQLLLYQLRISLNMRDFNKNWAFSSWEKSKLLHSGSMLTLLTTWWKRTGPDWHQRAAAIYNFCYGQSAPQMLDNIGLCGDECWGGGWQFFFEAKRTRHAPKNTTVSGCCLCVIYSHLKLWYDTNKQSTFEFSCAWYFSMKYTDLHQSPSQQNSSFRSLGIYVTSLLLVGLEQPLCWWLWRLFRPRWPAGSEGSHTATTVVSILESVYMLLWRATLCRMARSSSSS